MFINGTYRILYIKVEDDFLPVACLNENSFTEDIDILDSTTRDNNGWRTIEVTNQGYEISFSGVQINTAFIGGDFSKISYDRIKQIKRSKTLIEWKIENDGGLFLDTGFGYITQISESNVVDENISFEGVITGYGEPFSSSGIIYEIEDGNGNPIQDGDNNNLIT